MFENLLRRILGDSNPPPKAHAQDLGIKIETESDGIRLIKSWGAISTGDRLLLSYTLDGEHWERRVLSFQEERRGMFIYTGERPLSAFVVLEDDVREGKGFNSVKRSVYQSRRVDSDSRWSESFSRSDDFFDCMNPLSPCYGHGINNPLGLYYLFLHTDSGAHHGGGGASILDQLTTPRVDVPEIRHEPLTPPVITPETNAPPADPFDPKGVHLEAPLGGTNTVHGFHHTGGTNSFDSVEIKVEDKGFEAPSLETTPVEAPAPSESPSFGSEPNAYN